VTLLDWSSPITLVCSLGKTSSFVLVDALSLLNHHCDASVGYESPRVVPSTMTDIPAFVKLLGDCLLLQMFDSTDDSNHPGWQANEEILIHYGNHAFKECKCSGCVVESKDDYWDDDDKYDTATEPERKLQKADDVALL
jgi:hypothetical protein